MLKWIWLTGRTINKVRKSHDTIVNILVILVILSLSDEWISNVPRAAIKKKRSKGKTYIAA